MLVRDILARKGNTVVTIAPNEVVARLVALLAEHRVGALVVTEDGQEIAGIVSERDLARNLNAHGADVLTLPVSDLMTTAVQTCEPDDQIRDVAKAMTEGRFRHLPVVEDEKLTGIVSLGDVVKSRIDELEAETTQLTDYLFTGR